LIDVISLFLGEFLLAFDGSALCFFVWAGDVTISAVSRPTTANPIAKIMVAIDYYWIKEKCDKTHTQKGTKIFQRSLDDISKNIDKFYTYYQKSSIANMGTPSIQRTYCISMIMSVAILAAINSAPYVAVSTVCCHLEYHSIGVLLMKRIMAVTDLRVMVS
jgi:hypothetical protein